MINRRCFLPHEIGLPTSNLPWSATNPGRLEIQTCPASISDSKLKLQRIVISCFQLPVLERKNTHCKTKLLELGTESSGLWLRAFEMTLLEKHLQRCHEATSPSVLQKRQLDTVTGKQGCQKGALLGRVQGPSKAHHAQRGPRTAGGWYR